MQLTPLQSNTLKPVGRSEACTLRSAAACALAHIIENMGEELATAANPIVQASIPIFVPTYGPRDGFWSGVSCLGTSHHVFESERSVASSDVYVDVKRTLQVRFGSCTGTCCWFGPFNPERQGQGEHPNICQPAGILG